MSKPLSREEVQRRLQEQFVQDVTLVGRYENKRTPIRLRCMDCGHEWDALPVSVLYSKGAKHNCPNCVPKRNGASFECAYCGKEVYRSKSQIEKNETGLWYCSPHCGNLHKNRRQKAIGAWDNSHNYRQRAISAYGAECEACGWSEDVRVLEPDLVPQSRYFSAELGTSNRTA